MATNFGDQLMEHRLDLITLARELNAAGRLSAADMARVVKTPMVRVHPLVFLAEQKLAELEAEARSRWPLTGCSITHRLGHLELGEASIAIAVSSPHRQQAFEAGKWLIDTIKEVVPIWKQENWADGTSE